MPEEIVVAITAAAVSISKQLSSEDTALLGSALTQLGDTLTTISLARDRLDAAAKAQEVDQSNQKKTP
ncbi:MAG: hypothetical protein FWE19_05840 [Oscillospiraceae bacterium]|nr:hypothetical protein [Oscillospiraceae bacterium]